MGHDVVTEIAEVEEEPAEGLVVDVVETPEAEEIPVQAAVHESEGVEVAEVPDIEEVIEDTAPVEVKTTTTPTAPEAKGNFYIVGGSFRSASNAESFKETLRSKGFDSTVITRKDGLNLVTFGSWSNPLELKAKLAQIKASEEPDAWVLIH